MVRADAALELRAHILQRTQVAEVPVGALDAAHLLGVRFEYLVVPKPRGDLDQAPFDARVDDCPILSRRRRCFVPSTHVLQTPGPAPCSAAASLRSRSCEAATPLLCSAASRISRKASAYSPPPS